MQNRSDLEEIDRSLGNYRQRYLINQFNKLNEASTRLIVNHLLVDVLGYVEIEDIKPEASVANGYTDYIINLNKKELMVVEVKSLHTKLTNRHLSQAVTYAAIGGMEWIVLTDSEVFELYRVEFAKPLRVVRIFHLNLKTRSLYDVTALSFLTKKSVEAGGLEGLWRRN